MPRTGAFSWGKTMPEKYRRLLGKEHAAANDQEQQPADDESGEVIQSVGEHSGLLYCYDWGMDFEEAMKRPIGEYLKAKHDRCYALKMFLPESQEELSKQTDFFLDAAMFAFGLDPAILSTPSEHSQSDHPGRPPQ